MEVTINIHPLLPWAQSKFWRGDVFCPEPPQPLLLVTTILVFLLEKLFYKRSTSAHDRKWKSRVSQIQNTIRLGCWVHFTKIHFGKIQFGNQSLTVVGKSIQKIYQTDICLYSIFITGTQGEANSPFKEKVWSWKERLRREIWLAPNFRVHPYLWRHLLKLEWDWCKLQKTDLGWNWKSENVFDTSLYAFGTSPATSVALVDIRMKVRSNRIKIMNHRNQTYVQLQFDAFTSSIFILNEREEIILNYNFYRLKTVKHNQLP